MKCNHSTHVKLLETQVKIRRIVSNWNWWPNSTLYHMQKQRNNLVSNCKQRNKLMILNCQSRGWLWSQVMRKNYIGLMNKIHPQLFQIHLRNIQPTLNKIKTIVKSQLWSKRILCNVLFIHLPKLIVLGPVSLKKNKLQFFRIIIGFPLRESSLRHHHLARTLQLERSKKKVKRTQSIRCSKNVID